MRFLTLFLAVLMWSSCQSNIEYSEYVSLSDGEGWQKASPVSFQFQHSDSIAKKNVFIMLRNNEKYEFSNLFLITHMELPDRRLIIDTLEYEMATPEGKWLGYGYSSVKENKLWYKENFVFSANGTYTIKVEQAMRKIGETDGLEQLNGITEVGLQIENIQER